MSNASSPAPSDKATGQRERLVARLWERMQAGPAAGTSPPAGDRRVARTVMESLGVYLPPKVWSSEEVVAGCAAGLRIPLERMTGIESRHAAGDSEFSIDLAAHAVASCLSHSKYRADQIDALICCNISRYDGPELFTCEPSTSCRLRHRMGLVHAFAFDVSNACAGMFTGIRLADILLQSRAVQTVMVVSGEYITHLIRSAQQEMSHPNDLQMACLTLGDAGAAMVLELAESPPGGFHGIELYTLPQFSGLCIGKVSEHPHGGAIMLTQTVDMTRAMMDSMAFVTNMVERWSVTAGDIQHLIPHQTSKTTIRAFGAHARSQNVQLLSEDAIIDNLRYRGNTASTSHFVAVHDAILKGRVKSGDTVAFGIAASGMTTGAALYTFDDFPDRLRQGRPGEEGNGRRDSENNPPAAPGAYTRVLPPAKVRVRLESSGIVPLAEAWELDTLGLAVSAARDCFRRSQYSHRDIDLLLFAGVYRTGNVFEPAIASMIAGELGIRIDSSLRSDQKFLAYDVFNSSIGLLQSVFLASRELEQKRARRALIIAAEVEPNRGATPGELRGVQQAGSALILDCAPEGTGGFGAFGFRHNSETIGELSSCLRLRPLRGEAPIAVHRPPHYEQRYLAELRQVADRVLAAAKLDRSHLQCVLPPQISPSFTAALSDCLEVPLERFIQVGHEQDLFTSSLAYGLRAAEEAGLARAGNVGLFLGAGVGVEVGCALYSF